MRFEGTTAIVTGGAGGIGSATVNRVGPFLDTEPPLWDRLLSVNLRGPIAVTHEVLPHMVEAGGGSIVRATPLRRLAEPAEIAAAVAYLASDDASFVTGQTLSVSGGLTMI